MFTVQVPSWAGNTQRWTRPSLTSGCLCNPALVEQNQIILPASPCSPCHATPPSFSLIPWGLISRRAPRLFPEQLPSWAPSRLAFRGISPRKCVASLCPLQPSLRPQLPPVGLQVCALLSRFLSVLGLIWLLSAGVPRGHRLFTSLSFHGDEHIDLKGVGSFAPSFKTDTR